MGTSDLTLNHLPEFGGSQLLSAPRLVRRGREEEVFSKYVEDGSTPGTPCHLGEHEIMKPGCPEQTV